jgi:hypothetical protein
MKVEPAFDEIRLDPRFHQLWQGLGMPEQTCASTNLIVTNSPSRKDYFGALWKRGEPGIPILKETKAEYGKLE